MIRHTLKVDTSYIINIRTDSILSDREISFTKENDVIYLESILILL